MSFHSKILLIAMIISLTSCSRATQEGEVLLTDTSSTQQPSEGSPTVDVNISLNDTILDHGDSILLSISVTNNSDKEQKLLFDKPRTSTGGPWAMSGNVTDVNTGKSLVEYGNKAHLSSQIYTEEQLEDKYYHLKPWQTVDGTYLLTDIVVLNTSDKQLAKGMYEVQLFYHLNPSNVLTMKIQ
jgi:hypothetical protein